MILAIDLGSTFFKAGVFDAELTLRGAGSSRLTYQYADGGRVEIDVDHAVAALCDAVTGAIRSSGVDPALLQAVALTSQAQTFTVVDAQGRAKMPFISWQDARAEAACRALAADAAMADFAEHASFGQLIPALQICQLVELRNTQPRLIAPTDLVFNLPTFFVHRATGRAAVDANLAAMSGLYSLAAGDWRPEALRAAGVDRSQLAQIVPIGAVAATTNAQAAALGLPPDVPVVLAGNDQTAGAYGVELHRRGGLLITLGTAQVAYVCDAALARPAADVCRGPYPGGRFYRLAADSCGGNLVNWAETLLAGCASDDEFFALAAQASPGCGGLVLDGELPSADGVWRGIGVHHTPADFARSTIECLVRRMTLLVSQLGQRPSEGSILVAGGGSRQPLWRDLLSAALGRRLEATEADPLRGAARMAVETL